MAIVEMGAAKTSSPLTSRAALLVVLALAFAFAWGGLNAPPASESWFYICALGQAAMALAAARLVASREDRALFVLVIAAAIGLRLWFWLEPPILSRDIYRYIWDGRILNAGFNPYIHVPADPALIPLRDPQLYELIDRRDYAVTIYPPVAQALYAMVTRISGTVIAMKGAMLLMEAIAIFAAMRLLRVLGRRPDSLTLYLLHPAPIWEIANNGHVDALVMALVFSGFAWGAASNRPYWAVAAMSLGTLAKPTAALALPALWRPFDLRMPALSIAIAALCYLPFLSAGPGVIGFLPNYVHEQGLDNGNGFYAVALLRKLGLAAPWMTSAYFALAGAIMFALLFLVAFRVQRSLVEQLRGTALLILAFLFLLTPTWPWYFLTPALFAPLLGLCSPYAMITGGFLLYGFNGGPFDFFMRWSAAMAMNSVALAWDARSLLGSRTPR